MATSQAISSTEPSQTQEKKDYAIIATGGLQYTVCKGQRFKVTHIPNAKEGDTIHLERILCLLTSSGEVVFGESLKGKSVVATVGAPIKNKTIRVFHKKRRKNHRKTIGVRPKQHWLSVVSIPSV